MFNIRADHCYTINRNGMKLFDWLFGKKKKKVDYSIVEPDGTITPMPEPIFEPKEAVITTTMVGKEAGIIMEVPKEVIKKIHKPPTVFKVDVRKCDPTPNPNKYWKRFKRGKKIYWKKFYHEQRTG